MNLLIISNVAHYRSAPGLIKGWGPTVQEIGHLSGLFDGVTHICCIHETEPPASSLEYERPVDLVLVPPAGGPRLTDKLRILGLVPRYLRAIRNGLKDADAVHVRAPANISLLGILYLSVSRRGAYRWVKYAGNWGGYQHEPISYRFQRWLLRKAFHRGVVTVNASSSSGSSHVVPFRNPSLTESELEEGRRAAGSKSMGAAVHLLYVGTLSSAKGVRRLSRVAEELERLGVDYQLEIVGDGPERGWLEAFAKTRPDHVDVRGSVPKTALGRFYGPAHFILLPSVTEGWPKVLSEAMAYGAVPIATPVSNIPQMLAEIGSGRIATPEHFAEAVAWYKTVPDQWRKESAAAVAAAKNFTYERYLGDVRRLFQKAWGEEIPSRMESPDHV